MNDLPCFICPYISKCSLGQLQYNPKICPYMTLWLETSIKGEKYTANPFHPKFIDKKSAKEAKEAAAKEAAAKEAAAKEAAAKQAAAKEVAAKEAAAK